VNEPYRPPFEEHRDYLYEAVKLKLWYLWYWLREHPDEELTYVLRERVDIYRKTDVNDETMNPFNLHWDSPVWQDLEQRTEALHEKYSSDAVSFEKEAFAVFKPRIDGRARIDHEERPYVHDYNCGSLKYDPPRSENMKRVGFHIANAIRPRSIIEDPLYLPRLLLELIRKARAEHKAEECGSFTWLNAHPRWQQLFPDDWNKTNRSADDKNVKWHFGYWGQFISAAGTFNHKYGRILRETGEMPYWPFYSWCTFNSLEQHLRATFPDA
jgi:hypothetical protein